MNKRKDAPESYYCLRRIKSVPESFRQRPSTNFKDNRDEVSVDLCSSEPTEQELREKYSDLIQSKGVGFAVGKVEKINGALRTKKIIVAESEYQGEKGQIGSVKEDPILPDNPDHGVILGQEKTKIEGEERKLRKSEVLFKVFTSVIEPTAHTQTQELG